MVASSICRRSVIGANARIGPFAVLDEGSEVPEGGVVRAWAGRADEAVLPGGDPDSGKR